MLRVFLDANVLFSAAYRERAGLLALWKIRDARLLTSGYAAEEARRNLETPERKTRLERLLATVEIVPEASRQDCLAASAFPQRMSRSSTPRLRPGPRTC
jgi:predicted nucleic acid-binding protein